MQYLIICIIQHKSQLWGQEKYVNLNRLDISERDGLAVDEEPAQVRAAGGDLADKTLRDGTQRYAETPQRLAVSPQQRADTRDAEHVKQE